MLYKKTSRIWRVATSCKKLKLRLYPVHPSQHHPLIMGPALGSELFLACSKRNLVDDFHTSTNDFILFSNPIDCEAQSI